MKLIYNLIKKMEKFNGTLEAFFETSTESIWWALHDYKGKGYESLHKLDEGDYLKVYQNKDKEKIYWEGEICKDKKTNLKKIPCGSPYPRQVILGFYTHWLQKECDPIFWTDMFFNEMCAELERGEKRNESTLT
jgi:uncharacterized protein with PIN domain